MQDEDQRSELAKTLGDGINHMLKKHNDKVKEFLVNDMLQDFEPDTQRYEIEQVARVIVTPYSVEIYTFDDKVHLIQFKGTTIKEIPLQEDNDEGREDPISPAEKLVREARAMSENPNVEIPDLSMQ